MMASYDDRERTYHKGYRDGFKAGIEYASTFNPMSSEFRPMREGDIMPFPKQKRKIKQSRKQSPKQKLLTQLTDKKWKQYRKGSGKKTYIEIRAQVSRSQDYKRKAKRLK